MISRILSFPRPGRIKRLGCLVSTFGLLACGGCGIESSIPSTEAGDTTGGGSGGVSRSSSSGSGIFSSGTFLPYQNFAAKCASPRSGIDPRTGQPYPDTAGSWISENNWIRSWSNDLYLWYNEITDVDPATVYNTENYFFLMQTFATTASGAWKDKAHFSVPTSEWYALSQSGVAPGYGAEWAILSDDPPRQVVVAYTQPSSPATTAPANLARGAEVLEVDGIDLIWSTSNTEIDILNAGLWPDVVGENHTFKVRDLGSAITRTITLQSTNITLAPVQNVSVIPTATGNVGYMLFLDHIATAEEALIDAITQLQAAGIVDLVLDLRYNGGGYLAVASELAYMIAGAAQTDGQTFEDIRFNAKHTTTDPVTGQPLEPYPFLPIAIGLSAPYGQALPTLDLPRVFVLTGPNTCSASEAIMNGLEGVDIEVIQIGSTTCGKPYGFYPTDNCGTTYFSIQFKGVNAKNFGDYTDGFSPNNTVGTEGTLVPGCSVADDFTHALGDTTESRLATALNYRDTGTCPTPTGYVSPGLAKAPPARSLAAIDGRLKKSPWLSNRILKK